MTFDKPTTEDWLQVVAKGLNSDDATFTSIIKTALAGSEINTVRETTTFLKRLMMEETPNRSEEIMEMSKDEIMITIYRINLFEKLRHPVVDDEQLESLYRRTVDLWGESPTEPVGRWAEWNLWVTRHRRRNGISITELIEGKKTIADIRRKWGERHQAREERRKLHKMNNYEQYHVPGEVPASLRHLLVRPFIQDDPADSEMNVPYSEEMNIQIGTETDQVE